VTGPGGTGAGDDGSTAGAVAVGASAGDEMTVSFTVGAAAGTVGIGDGATGGTDGHAAAVVATTAVSLGRERASSASRS
jgi:hypothetical protein